MGKERKERKGSVEDSVGGTADYTLRWLTPPFRELTEPPPAGRDGIAAGTSSYDALPGELLGELPSPEEPEDG